MKLWNRWVSHCARDMDARPLALLRILLPLCVIGDLLRVVQLGLLSHVFQTFENGGISRIQDPHLWVDALAGTSTGPLLLVITLVAMSFAMVGIATRPALLIGIIAYAQLGHLYPPGDRAIDRLVRTGLLILLFSGAHRRFSLSRATAQLRIPAWPADMIKFVLVLVYLSAGISKLIQQPGWLSFAADPPLLRIVIDPLAGELDPAFWAGMPWLFRLAGFVTIAFELSAPMLLTRWYAHWALIGVVMHLGIAMTMTLGMFSWGMLAFYPLLLAPWILPMLERNPKTANP